MGQINHLQGKFSQAERIKILTTARLQAAVGSLQTATMTKPARLLPACVLLPIIPPATTEADRFVTSVK